MEFANPKELIEHSVYSNLLNSKSSLKSGTFKTHPEERIPIIGKSEFESEYIRRFFAIKANDRNSTIYEISVDQYPILKKNPFYTVEQTRWKITGPLRTIYDRGIQQKVGVIDYNEIAFNTLKSSIPNLSKKITSLTQFYIADYID
jgi:hypothetical protein